MASGSEREWEMEIYSRHHGGIIIIMILPSMTKTGIQTARKTKQFNERNAKAEK